MEHPTQNHTADGQGHQTVDWVQVATSALRTLDSGPPLGAFGIAREDCALVHMDWFLDVHYVQHMLAEAIAAATGRSTPDVFAEHGRSTPCDGRCCVGRAKAAEARAEHVAAYTNVAAWHKEPGFSA